MSIASKLGLAYSMYHGNPYRSFREVILPDVRCRDPFSPEREKKFFSSLIVASSLRESTSSCEKRATEEVPHNPPSALGGSFAAKKISPAHDKGSRYPSSLEDTCPIQEPLPNDVVLTSPNKRNQADAAIQVNFLLDETLPLSCPDPVLSTEVPSSGVGTIENEEAQELKSTIPYTPSSSPPTKAILSERDFVLHKEEPTTVVHATVEPVATPEHMVVNKPASQEMDRGSANSLQSDEINKGTANPSGNLCSTPQKDVVDVGVGMEEVEYVASLLPASQVSGGGEERINSLDNSLQHMIPAACLSDVVDCILKKIQVHNVHAVALDDLIQQLSKHIPSTEQAEIPAKPTRTQDDGATQQSHGDLDFRTKHELAIYLYSLRDEVQQLTTQLDATEKSFQRSLREHASRRNNTRKIEVEIVKAYEEDPIPYKKLPYRPANLGAHGKTETTGNGSNYAEYEDDFTFDEDETNTDSRTSEKKNSILSSSSSSSRMKGRTATKTAPKKVAKKRSISSSFSSSAATKTASTVVSSSIASSSRRSTVLSSISSSLSTSSSLSSSIRKPSQNVRQQTGVKNTNSRLLKQKSSQKPITNNKSHFVGGKREKERRRNSSLFSSSSRISSSPTSHSSSKNSVSAVDDAAIKDFWARRTHQVQTTEKDLSSASLSTISTRS